MFDPGKLKGIVPYSVLSVEFRISVEIVMYKVAVLSGSLEFFHL